MNTPVLYLMVGYPGAGKTTVAQTVHELTGATHIWTDQVWRDRYDKPSFSADEKRELYDHLNAEVDTLLGEGKSVIYDTNFNYYKDRELMRTLAAKHNADTILFWVQVPKEMAQDRATKNAHLQTTRVFGDIKPSVFEKLTDHLEPPRADEHPIQIDGTKVTSEYISQKLGL